MSNHTRHCNNPHLNDSFFSILWLGISYPDVKMKACSFDRQVTIPYWNETPHLTCPYRVTGWKLVSCSNKLFNITMSVNRSRAVAFYMLLVISSEKFLLASFVLVKCYLLESFSQRAWLLIFSNECYSIRSIWWWFLDSSQPALLRHRPPLLWPEGSLVQSHFFSPLPAYDRTKKNLAPAAYN